MYILNYNTFIKESCGVNGNYTEAFWMINGEDGEDITLTIKDIENYINDNNIPTVDVNVKDIFHLCIHKDRKDNKTLERSKLSDLKFPIICLSKKGEITHIIDGHHRLLKAKNDGLETIKANVIDLEKAPPIFRKIFK